MKKYIKSAQASEDFQISISDIEGLAYECGYELNAKPDNQIEINIKNSKDPMPSINVIGESDSNGVYTYNTIVSFPNLDFKENKKTIAYYLNLWTDISDLIEAVNDFEYVSNI